MFALGLQTTWNPSDLTTVTITVNERKGYVPPTEPAFTTTIGRTFNDSLGALVGLGKGLVLFFAALTPWLPILLALGVVGWLLVRRARRRPVVAAPVQQ